MNYLIEMLLKSILEQIITLLGQVEGDILARALDLAELPMVTQYMPLFSKLAILFISLYLTGYLSINYVMRNNSSVSTPAELFWRCTVAIVVGSNAWGITTGIFKIFNSIAKEIASYDVDFSYDVEGLTVVSLLILIIGVVGLLITFIQASIRSGKIALLCLLGPIFAIGYIRDDKAMFSGWVKEIIALGFSQIVQIILFNMSMNVFVTMDAFLITRTLTFLGIVIMMISAPKWLKGIVESTGTGKGLAAGGKQATMMVLARKMITKGV